VPARCGAGLAIAAAVSRRRSRPAVAAAGPLSAAPSPAGRLRYGRRHADAARLLSMADRSRSAAKPPA